MRLGDGRNFSNIIPITSITSSSTSHPHSITNSTKSWRREWMWGKEEHLLINLQVFSFTSNTSPFPFPFPSSSSSSSHLKHRGFSGSVTSLIHSHSCSGYINSVGRGGGAGVVQALEGEGGGGGGEEEQVTKEKLGNLARNLLIICPTEVRMLQ